MEIIHSLSQMTGLPEYGLWIIFGAVLFVLKFRSVDSDVSKLELLNTRLEDLPKRNVHEKLFADTFQLGSQVSSSVLINMNGQETNLDPKVSAELMDLIQRGAKLNAIKLLRENSGLELTPAKQMVDAMTKAIGKK